MVPASVSPENATITRSILVRRDELVEFVEVRRARQMVDLGSARSGVLVDESDEPDPVLGVLLDLTRDELAHVTRADDDAGLDERARSSLRMLARRTRPARTRVSASAQKVTSRPSCGCDSSVAHAVTKTTHVPRVTRLTTPNASSAVEWSALASSCW